MSGGSKITYADRINGVCDYIGEHLHEDLSVGKVSRIANFSRYPFHRQFSVYTGISVARYILMLRVQRTSCRLVFEQDCRIIDMAMDAGFESPEPFSRAFKNALGQTPSQFRRQPIWKSWNEYYRGPVMEWKLTMKVEIVEFNETRVAVREHRGAPARVQDSVDILVDWRKQSGLSPVASCKTYGIAYDDPESTPAEQFRFDLCAEVAREVPANPQGIINKTIPAGRCARLRHGGPFSGLAAKVHYLYGVWLPASGEALRDFPCFFHYLTIFPQVPEQDLITDIYLPLK